MANLPKNLPDEVRAVIAPYLDPDVGMLNSIGAALAAKRDEAVNARKSSGIEQVWIDCERAYCGIDDTNIHEHGGSKWAKPLSPDGPVMTGRPPAREDNKSNLFVRVTSRYVDAAAAKVGEILLPTDDKAFSIDETPIPEWLDKKDDTSQVVDEELGPLTRPAEPGELSASTGQQPVPVPGAPPVAVAAPAGGAVLPSAGAAEPPAEVPLTVKDVVKEQVELARKKAKKAEKRIYDWMVECQYTAEARKIIFDCARLGVGVLKGPYPKVYRNVAAQQDDAGGVKVTYRETIKPAAKWIDPWNIFPDPACGENINDGDFIFERDHLSERQVQKLKGEPGYIGSQIEKVIAEGPSKIKLRENQPKPGSLDKQGERYEVWYFVGILKLEELACICHAAGHPLDKAEGQAERVSVIVTMINDSVVRATPNLLDSGEFGYHSVPWQRRAGYWAGIGVAEQVAVPQRIVNGATRRMMDNAGLASGGQIIIDESGVRPADGTWALTPNKIWLRTQEGANSAKDSFSILNVAINTTELMAIIEYGMRLAEESSSIPLITQGQSGATSPDTYGATQLQNNNANQLLRAIGYAYDDYITEPLVRQFYEWLLLDPEVPDDEKGDFTINAHGSVALVERAIQDQTIAQMAQVVLDPRYGLDPKKWAEVYLKSKRIAPKDVQLSEQEEAAAAAQPPVPAPQVQVAQIRAQQEDKKLAATVQAQNADRELRTQEVRTGAVLDLNELEMKRELALLDYANRHQISIEQAQAQLAKTAMTLRSQEKLSRQIGGKKPRPIPQVATAAAEPPGRAPNGYGFTQ